MEYLQYFAVVLMIGIAVIGFKPYYKWNTFNTVHYMENPDMFVQASFKPYYKWNTFNTMQPTVISVNITTVLNLIINGIPSILEQLVKLSKSLIVLNLIINGIPSILENNLGGRINGNNVLNLIINGIPSILYPGEAVYAYSESFKPYYKWNTFNTQ